MEKKISFGFSKIIKKSNLLINKIEPKDDENKIELIKCVEGQAIQLVKNKEEEAPLVIPLKDGGKTSAALLSLRTRQAVLNGEEVVLDNEKESVQVLPPQPNGIDEDIEKRAARELLAEVSKGDDNEGIGPSLVLPLKAEDIPLDGAKESTIDDYESIPITQFGKAMLRGMGWKDIPKKKGAPIEDGPTLRPKGMGLGADKALKPKALLIPPEANEVLEIKKGACVRVLGGKNKDLYGQVEGLDDHAGRVIIKMALGGAKESFNEFMVQPVSKKEYSQYSKCINSTKYDEYKRMENEHGQIVHKKESIKKEDTQSDERHYSNAKSNERIDNRSQENEGRKRRTSRERISERRSRSRDRHHDEEYSRSSTSHKKYNNRRTPSRHRSQSNDSQSSSESSSHRRNKHKKKSSKSKKSKSSKDKRRERRYSTDGSSVDERRHKKKTKKSKRERSRSRSKGRR
ncbi:G-patch domain and KOW motifs-containing protein [Episyrphus balteatus]|uniref:G-patch domain and KOW motifs-containing protein n=1 Tax=Episyrphus balteatus TaxID=286459 RepID=UPI0024859C9C|nr:G-patch domain and KOW motifs-containing protein [Episyrphus balteatus]